MTTRTFQLPDVGEGLTEAQIVGWHVAVGDRVTVNQVLVEIETAKSVVELPSPREGTVARLLVAPGETVPVGQPIIEFGDEVPSRDEAPKLLVGYGVSESSSTRRRRRPNRAVPKSGPSTTGSSSTGPDQRTDAAEKPRAKPPVRRLARQLGINLTTVAATGPDGTVTREDVTRASSAATVAATTPAAADSAGATRIPITGVRRLTAAAMVRSAFTAPHVTEFVTIDVTRTLELRERLLLRPEFDGLKLSPLALIARAYLLALERTPMAAAKWDDEAQEIVLPGDINLGIAAATPRGLMVPNIKSANRLGLVELSSELRALTRTARADKTPPADLADGSTTITNIGVFGIDTGTPILNPGETSILAVGAIKRRPWVVDDAQGERLEIRSVLQLALSFDHRVIDGAEGSQLLADTADLLTDPGLAMR